MAFITSIKSNTTIICVLGAIHMINMSGNCFTFHIHMSGYTLHTLTNKPTNQPTRQTTH